jgi:hypothetical protein
MPAVYRYVYTNGDSRHPCRCAFTPQRYLSSSVNGAPLTRRRFLSSFRAVLSSSLVVSCCGTCNMYTVQDPIGKCNPQTLRPLGLRTWWFLKGIVRRKLRWAMSGINRQLFFYCSVADTFLFKGTSSFKVDKTSSTGKDYTNKLYRIFVVLAANSV